MLTMLSVNAIYVLGSACCGRAVVITFFRTCRRITPVIRGKYYTMEETMRKTVLLCIAVLIFFAGTSIVFSEKVPEKEPDQVKASIDSVKKIIKKDKDARIIRIEEEDGVTPQLITIKQGSVVVWLNRYQADVTIRFDDKKVKSACKHSVNFSLNEKGQYVSSLVGYGSVASLCFMEKGNFKYVVDRSRYRRNVGTENLTDTFKFDGRINVE